MTGPSSGPARGLRRRACPCACRRASGVLRGLWSYLWFIRLKRADVSRFGDCGCAAGFFRHGSGVQWDSRKRSLVMRTIRGLDAPLAHRSLDRAPCGAGSCQVASPGHHAKHGRPDSVSPGNSSVSALTSHTQVLLDTGAMPFLGLSNGKVFRDTHLSIHTAIARFSR